MQNVKSQSKVLTIVAEAGLLTAMMVVIQLITLPIKAVPLASQLVTGSLVNLVLILGAGTTGLIGAGLAGVLSPVLAVLFGQMAFPPLIPVVAIGNFLIVLISWAIFRLAREKEGGVRVLIAAAGIILGALVKTAFLWLGVTKIMTPLMGVTAQNAAKLSLMFGLPQLITALIGGVFALAILPPVQKARKRRGI